MQGVRDGGNEMEKIGGGNKRSGGVKRRRREREREKKALTFVCVWFRFESDPD